MLNILVSHPVIQTAFAAFPNNKKSLENLSEVLSDNIILKMVNIMKTWSTALSINKPSVKMYSIQTIIQYLIKIYKTNCVRCIKYICVGGLQLVFESFNNNKSRLQRLKLNMLLGLAIHATPNKISSFYYASHCPSFPRSFGVTILVTAYNKTYNKHANLGNE